MEAVSSGRTALYRTIWRWHFYAGLFVMPMIIILSITGAIYLFKPQIEAWEERAFTGYGQAAAVSPDGQVVAAMASVPGARVHSYRLPRRSGDAAMVHLALPHGESMRDVFVSPQGRVVGILDPEARIMAVTERIHGQLLIGHRGSWIVELAASWAIVMILSGLYLWWPRGRGAAGVVWPRWHLGRRAFWRDLHAVTGFWVAGLAMILLLTGLPWADVWGSAFKTVRAEMGWVKGQQDWTIGGRAADGGDHAEHDHRAMMAGMNHEHSHSADGISLTAIVSRAEAQRLPFPVIVTPPGMPQRFGAKASAQWTVRSDTQNRPNRVTIRYDAATGVETGRETFADKHAIDRVIGYGIAWHEGQLFGLANQLIGVATALMLVLMAASGFIMWRRRKPDDTLGAPPVSHEPLRPRGVASIVLALAALLPMLALSLLALVALEWLVLRRIPHVARWLGLAGVRG